MQFTLKSVQKCIQNKNKRPILTLKSSFKVLPLTLRYVKVVCTLLGTNACNNWLVPLEDNPQCARFKCTSPLRSLGIQPIKFMAPIKQKLVVRTSVQHFFK